MSARLRPYLLIAVLGLLFFARLVLHPSQVLYSDHSDLLALHLPAKHFLVSEWQQTGELPLWCPYRFAGVPFVHDIQVGVFYPPHWPLYWLPPSWLGAALSWLIVLHLIVAGWGMVAYARDQGLNDTGAIVAALGTMFAGKWMLHLLGGGHYITLGLAWLPLVLLWLERAIRVRNRGALFHATGAGVAFALVVLGTHPQWTFYAGVFIAAWTLGPALEQAGYLDGTKPRSRRRTTRALGRWFGFGTWTVLVAVSLSAVQLLPTLEATGESMRGTGVDARSILRLGLLTLVGLVGPSLSGTQPLLMWEDRTGLTLLWLAAAVWAPFLGGSRVRYQAGVCLGLIVFALGGAALVHWLPGFSLFRQPSRMCLIVALPVAYLAGVTVQALTATPAPPESLRHRCRFILGRLAAVTAILFVTLAIRLSLEGDSLRFDLYWLSLLVTVPAAYWLLGTLPPWAERHRTVAWMSLLLLDLWALTWPLVDVRPFEQVMKPSAAVQYLADRGEAGRVLDRDPEGDGAGTPLGRGAPLAMLEQIEAVRGYTPLDVLRFKEYLQFIGDTDEPLRPFKETDGFERSLTFPVIGNFPIRNKALLDLLGVRYLLQPSEAPLESSNWQEVMADPDSRVYDFIAGGTHHHAYTLYRNPDALPRAFVVPGAEVMPPRSQVLEALRSTDFRKRVLLEGWQPEAGAGTPTGSFREAQVREYRPNRVVIDVKTDAPGYLVLADVWFPGWNGTVDGDKTPSYRANYLFRGVPVAAGEHTVVFTFEPESYLWGKAISSAALGLVPGLMLLGGLFVMHAARMRP